MPKTSSTTLKPRKQPTQARANETVRAISEATIQVLLKEGLKKLTTETFIHHPGAFFHNGRNSQGCLRKRGNTKYDPRVKACA